MFLSQTGQDGGGVAMDDGTCPALMNQTVDINHYNKLDMSVPGTTPGAGGGATAH